MKRYLHIGYSQLTGTIFAGKILKDGRTWAAGKEDVTIEALVAVAQHVVNFGAPVEISKSDGTGVEYRITVEHIKQKKEEEMELEKVAVKAQKLIKDKGKQDGRPWRKWRLRD